MSKSEDINTLFRRFGGDASSYQEIVSIDQTRAAEQQWPLLGQLKSLAHAEAPAAKRSAPAGNRTAQVEVVIYKTAPQTAHMAGGAPVIEHSAAMSQPLRFTERPAVHSAPDEPVLAAPVASPDLKTVFDRMLPRTVEVAQPVPVGPTKKLIKW